MTGSQQAAQPQTPDQPLPGMAAEHALLGLLAMTESGVSHGYELARHFEAASALGSVIRLEPGMVYHHVKKLERLGWVATLIDESVRPVRRMVVLQGEGRNELQRWLAEPVAHTREIRLDFLVKLYFALSLDPRLAQRLVAEQRAMSARVVEGLAERADGGGDTQDAPRERQFSALVLDLRQAQTHAALAWLDRVGQEAGDALARRTTAMPGDDPAA